MNTSSKRYSIIRCFDEGAERRLTRPESLTGDESGWDLVSGKASVCVNDIILMQVKPFTDASVLQSIFSHYDSTLLYVDV